MFAKLKKNMFKIGRTYFLVSCYALNIPSNCIKNHHTGFEID